MNIIIINHYAGSSLHGMEYRPYYLSREWVKMGHNVTIIAASFSHLRQKNPDLRTSIREVISGINYIWIKTPSYRGNGLARAVNISSFITSVLLNAKSFSKKCKPDIVIASSTYPLDIFAAYIISRFSGAKLIFELHDIWPLSLIELSGMHRFNPFAIATQIAADFAYKKSDKVVSVLPYASEYMVTRGLNANKFAYIPNGVNIGDYRMDNFLLPLPYDEVIERAKRQGKYLVCYTGYIGTANALSYFVKSAVYLNGLPITLTIVGDGPEKGTLQRYVREKGIDNIVFLPPLEKQFIPSLLSKMDILYIGGRKTCLYRFGISPNKLFDYMMAGKPIIHAVQAANDLVAEAGCGLSVRAEDPIAIAEAIKSLIKMPAEVRLQMGQNGRDYVKKYHDYKVLAKKFMDVINDLAKKS